MMVEGSPLFEELLLHICAEGGVFIFEIGCSERSYVRHVGI
jgi:hypothetical protein